MWRQFNFSRHYTIGLLDRVDEKQWDSIPFGFANSIRWNAGHIFVVLESILAAADADYPGKHKEYEHWFARGTSPKEWSDEAPSKTTLVQLLKEQSQRVHEYFEGREDAPAAVPLTIGNHLSMKTAGDILQFAIWHEGMHLGVLNRLRIIVEED